ncbi:NtrC-family two-component system sensor histidine kinase KinB [Ereboglobus sp. PH5-10]|uniref:HAMP domain-containing sensor histidine kinase n=1 Tax=Ereboglobus sp. PH5-10 TaxID=2940629 RepID=UPI002406C9A6|nr:ATP-binding protein [Ereboglobus sp. PH5-10]MDF9827797.1 NtrC-family two-component system sensor histidine kinase KinB [Ereboglobus sp. PH5-10]
MLRNKLYLGLLPLLALLILVGVAGILVNRDLARSSSEKIDRGYSMVMGEHEMRGAALGMVTAMHSALRGNVLEVRGAYEEQRGLFKQTLMAQSFSAAGTEREKAVRQVSRAFGRFENIGDSLMVIGGSFQDAGYEDVERAYFGVLHSLDELLRTDSRVMQVESERVAGIARVSIGVLVVVMVIGIALSVLLAFRLARMFIGPISALTESSRALGEGNLEKDVPVTSRDELGVLAQSFNAMAASLREYRDAMAARVLRAQRTMEATLTSTPDPLFVVSPDGKSDIRNPAAERLAALPEFADGFPEPLDAHVREVLRTREHFLPTGYDQVIPVSIDHDERFYLPRILSVSDKLTGREGGAAILLQDVTKFRLLDDAKNNLVGTVSHELKTPLTSLRMAVYLLLEQNTGALTPAQRDLLETARDDADRLLRILNDILDLARIESGTAALSRCEVEPAALLEEMAREMRPLIEDAGQRLEVRVAPGAGVDGKVFLDPDRIRHVFVNLLGNASKYTPEGGRIELYAEPDAEPGAVRFGVRDTGAGIAETDLPCVFQKFYRAPGQKRRGAGLGLSIAREVVLAHGGTIACASKAGAGSDFYFTIPPRRPENAAAS